MSTIPERDWKKLRGMKDVLLDTACERIFQKIQAISMEGPGGCMRHTWCLEAPG